MTTERQAEQAWIEQQRLDNLRKTGPRPQPIDIEGRIRQAQEHQALAARINRQRGGYVRYGVSPVELLVDVGATHLESLRKGQGQPYDAWGALSPFPGPPPCPVIGNAYGSTWNHSPRVRARVLRCVACPNPARGLEPYCANCADWHTCDEAIAGPGDLSRWPAVVAVVVGIVLLIGGCALAVAL